MSTVVARAAHKIPDRLPLRLAVGEQVDVGDRDNEWPEFVFVTSSHGSGWVPARHLSASSGTAVLQTAYDTTELTTQAGDVVEVLAEDLASGWVWCRSADGREGWVPRKTLDLRAVVYLIVGLPGAGKTTRAKELETGESALRLTPDEWQISLFGDQNPPDKRDLVEGRLIQLGMRAAQLGINVVFDFGFWGRDERSALRWIAATVGARSHVIYLPIDSEEQRRRVTTRFATTPDQTFHISDVELEQWRVQFQVPDDDELHGSQIPPAPREHPSWSHWASQRWPSLPDQYVDATIE